MNLGASELGVGTLFTIIDLLGHSLHFIFTRVLLAQELKAIESLRAKAAARTIRCGACRVF